MRGFITAWGGEHDRRSQFTSFQVGEERGLHKEGWRERVREGGNNGGREGGMEGGSLTSILTQ